MSSVEPMGSQIRVPDGEASESLFKRYRALGIRLMDKHAKDVTFIDVRNTLGVADLFVIVTALNDVHMDALEAEAEEYLESHFDSIRREGEDSRRWRLLDAGDVVVHIFSRDARDFYRIEKIWGDSEVMTFEDPDA
ncbi:Iojap-related protein [Thermanaerovibrio acidaminovorans DSM 6589]|uniref:Ribosomal silencing factor RsfS n=2 Tax=Thermanaerovibrio TaxID=81461 RepID=D1BA22_THEAS|nr:Iojap-related protein [Thermanaerovibrio acidaminovorans DSM 6589]